MLKLKLNSYAQKGTILGKRTLKAGVTTSVMLIGLVLSGVAAPSAAYAAPVSNTGFQASVSRAAAPNKLAITSKTPATISAGSRITIKGKAATKYRGKSVNLQIKSGSKWKTVATGKIKSNRTYSVSTKANKSGKLQYRVTISASKGLKAAKSATLTYKSYAWFNLYTQRVGYDFNNETNVTTKIGGVTYPHSTTVRNTQSREYNVNYRCTKFRASIGMSDTAPSGASRDMTLFIDDASKSFGTVTLGAARKVTADISGAFRLTLAASGGNKDAYSSFGTPQVYCLGKP